MNNIQYIIKSSFAYVFFLTLLFNNATVSAQTPELTLQTGHSDDITALAASPDGKFLLSAGKDNVIILWDYTLGKEIRRYKSHTAAVSDLIFSGDMYFFSAGLDNMVLQWNLNETSPVRALSLKEPVVNLDISADKTLLLIKTSSGASVYNIIKDTLSYDIMKNTYGKAVFLNNEPVVAHGNNNRKNKGVYLYNMLNGSIKKISKDRADNVIVTEINNQAAYSSAYKSEINFYDFRDSHIYTRPGDYSRYRFVSLALCCNDSVLAAGNNDNSVYLFSTLTHRRINIIKKLPAPPVEIIYNNNLNDLIFSSGREIYIWDVYKNRLKRKISTFITPVTAVAIRGDGQQVALAGTDNQIKIFDISGNPEFKVVNSHDAGVTGLVYISDTVVVSAGFDNKVKFTCSDTSFKPVEHKAGKNLLAIADRLVSSLIPLSLGGNIVTMFYLGKSALLKRNETVNTLTVSHDKKYSAAGGGGWRGLISTTLITRNFPVHIYDNTNQRKLFTLYGHYEPLRSLSFNRNGKYLASCGYYDNYLKLWDIQKKKLITTFYSERYFSSVSFSTVNDTLLLASSNELFFFHPGSVTATKITGGKKPAFFSNGGKNIYYQDDNYNIVEYSISEAAVSKIFKGHNDLITKASLSQNGERLVTSSWDGTVKIWNTGDGKEIASLIALNDNDFIIKSPDNYYYATKKAKEEIGFSKGLKFYPFEQSDLKNNRPDIILERLGFADTALVHAYRNAYYRRLKKMNFDESMFNPDFHFPEIKITDNRQVITVDSAVFNIVIEAWDTKYNLDRIKITLNNVPLYGSQGISLRHLDTNKFVTTVPVELPFGKSMVQVSCFNDKGVESLKDYIEINYNKELTKPDLYIITIGTSEYKDTRFNLTYAAKDAADLTNLFSSNTGLYSNVHTRTLTDGEVTKENIFRLKEFLSGAKVNDVVILFIAGHGILDKNFDYYFGTYDIDFENPPVSGLAYSELESLLENIKPVKKIIFMDTCHSGEIDKEEVEFAQNLTAEQGDIRFRSSGADIRNKSGLKQNNVSGIMKLLFNDLRTGTGTTVISSSDGVEFAMESDKWKNGLFTHCLINGIKTMQADTDKDGVIMLPELQDYVREKVKQLSGGRQAPTPRVDNSMANIRIW